MAVRHVGARLLQLLIHFGRIDLHQQLTLGDAGSQVRCPAPDEAAGAGEDRGVGEGLDVALQHDLLGGVPRFGWATSTIGMERSKVACARLFSARTRGTMPATARPTATSRPRIRKRTVRERLPGCGGPDGKSAPVVVR